METGRSWYESAIRSQRVKDAVERNARAGKRTGGGSRPFGYKIIRHDLGEGGRPKYRIIGEEIEPAEAEAIKEAAARVLRGESIRSIAFDFNDRGIKPVGGWVGGVDAATRAGLTEDRQTPRASRRNRRRGDVA
jgi:site-specific DNA recombinase